MTSEDACAPRESSEPFQSSFPKEDNMNKTVYKTYSGSRITKKLTFVIDNTAVYVCASKHDLNTTQVI